MLLSSATLELRPALDPVHDTQATFRVLLEALSEPGVWRQLPALAVGAPANPWLAAVLLTLLDHETSFAVLTDTETEEFVRARTNVRRASLDEADFVLAESTSLTPQAVLALRRGSLAYPDDSATLIVDAVDDTSDRETSLMLNGAGIPGAREARVGLAETVLRALEDANGNYPCGVDVLVVDAAGRVLGLPRSTRFGER